jgi:hypothetical protein
MPITFTNHLDTNVLSALQELINAEFTQSVYYDTEYMQRGTNWFNLVPVADILEDNFSSSHTRAYEVLIQYYRIVPGDKRKSTHIATVSAIMERLKRLIRSNSDYRVNGEQKFFNGTIANVNYQPELEDVSSDVLLVEATFTANVFEVI